MIKDRVFRAYGCSFTAYNWYPTWAMMLAVFYETAYNNAKGGAGNSSIANYVLNDLRNGNIDENTDLLIQWSGFCRYDIFKKNSFYYEGGGNPFHNRHLKELNLRVNIVQPVLESINYIYAVESILKDSKVNYKMTHMLDPTFGPFLGEPGVKCFNSKDFENITEKEQKLVENLLSEYRKNKFTNFLDTCITLHSDKYPHLPPRKPVLLPGGKVEVHWDGHPTPLQHYFYLVDKIMPGLGIKVEKKYLDKLYRIAAEWTDYTIQDTFYKQNKFLEENFVLDKEFKVASKTVQDSYIQSMKDYVFNGKLEDTLIDESEYRNKPSSFL